MSARILVVDDLAPNLHLLQVKLQAEYYDVLTARSGHEALEIASKERLDLILMDAMMPGINGFEACQRIKNNPDTWHVPVVMVTALEETKDRIRGLEAGADDFITKPIDDFNLMARVRSLLRLKMTTDQLLSHTGHTASNSRTLLEQIESRPGRILLIEDHEKHAKKMMNPLEDKHKVLVEGDPVKALRLAKTGMDLIIVSLVSSGFDGLRVCASLRFSEKTRDIPILVVGDPDDETRFVRAYDIGINDTLMRPIEIQELKARVTTLMRRKFYADSLRDNFNENLEMVVADSLTGLGNRRYFDRAIEPLLDELDTRDTPFSIMVFDIDHFKRVNDILGHPMGDVILKEVAARLVSNMRAVDIVSRYGGEEFMIAMPNTEEADALKAADRVRGLIAGSPIYVDGQSLIITTSAGVAQVQPGENLRDVFKRADDALYRAKQAGRNKVLPASANRKAA
ncbi:PleD family two-component system response regulator [Litorimonas sp. RW-G-Af-16]|uniref:PleD family two-component system response regulator n=1 Tax=Litorimonas sp. RW-G-Af-16 TaxID=3241168 RepID=UPI00390CB34D